MDNTKSTIENENDFFTQISNMADVSKFEELNNQFAYLVGIDFVWKQLMSVVDMLGDTIEQCTAVETLHATSLHPVVMSGIMDDSKQSEHVNILFNPVTEQQQISALSTGIQEFSTIFANVETPEKMLPTIHEVIAPQREPSVETQNVAGTATIIEKAMQEQTDVLRDYNGLFANVQETIWSAIPRQTSVFSTALPDIVVDFVGSTSEIPAEKATWQTDVFSNLQVFSGNAQSAWHNIEEVTKIVAGSEYQTVIAQMSNNYQEMNPEWKNADVEENSSLSTSLLLSSETVVGSGQQQVQNINITITGGLIGQVDNHFSSTGENPESAGDFMERLAEALKTVVNDVKYTI